MATKRLWIQSAISHPGALHRQLHVPAGEKIPAAKLKAAAKKGGKLGQRARLAETLRGFERSRYHSHPAHPYSHPVATKHRRK